MSTGARTGVANLPLHYGATPRWLFERMTRLARQLTLVIVEEFGPQEVLAKLSDPLWFQAFGCVLGFDWHSSGVTTTVCGALKEGLRGLEKDSGLVYASRMAAKVDSAALQDDYQLYHHTFVFSSDGAWTVIQQGMNEATRWARRYHWLSSAVDDFVCEPHKAICSDGRGVVLNMVAEESDQCRDLSARLAGERPDKLVGELKRLQTLELPQRHHIQPSDIHPDKLAKIFLKTYERQPQDFERLLGMEGVGAKTIRALALVSELVYGAKASVRDPARFSFAHGGKDGHPYPVDRRTYDRSIEALRAAVERAKLGRREKLEALRRLAAV